MLVVEGMLAGFTAFVARWRNQMVMYRICQACAAAKSSTKDAVKAPTGKR